MSLTRSGRFVLIGAVALALSGRILGLDELMLLAAGTVVVVIGAAITVRRARIGFEIGRSVRPGRLPAGGSTTVTLRLRNTTAQKTPVISLTDPISRAGSGLATAPGTEPATDGTARLELAPVPAGATRELSYRLPTPNRGVLVVGPLELSHTDAFGLIRRSLSTKAGSEVIVLPRIHDLVQLPPASGEQPESGPVLHEVVVSANEEFAAIREYVPGDDVRRVHWRTTARFGVPMVRHYEEPWQHRTTIVVDVRRANHDAASFERAMSATASVLALCAREGELVRLISTTGDDSGFLSDRGEVDHAISRLAAMSPHGAGSLTGAVHHLVRRSVGGTLVSITGSLPSSEASTLSVAGSRFGAHVRVQCRSAEADATDGGAPPPAGGRAATVKFAMDTALEQEWAAAAASLAPLSSSRAGAARTAGDRAMP